MIDSRKMAEIAQKVVPPWEEDVPKPTDDDLPKPLPNEIADTIENPNDPEFVRGKIQMIKTPLEQLSSGVDELLKNVSTWKLRENKVLPLQKLLNDDSTTDLDKIKIANFFCVKIHSIYKCPEDLEKDIIRRLKPAVENNTELPIRLRLYYLRYINEVVVYWLSYGLRTNHANMDYSSYFQALKYLLRSYLSEEELRQDIAKEFQDLFEKEDTGEFVKMDIADCLLLSQGFEKQGREMVNKLREADAEKRAEQGHEIIENVFHDSQNVHDDDINESVLRASCRLIRLGKQHDYDEEVVIKELKKIDPEHKIASSEDISRVLDRVCIDSALFRYKDPADDSAPEQTFNMHKAVANLWYYITNHPSSDTLKIRFLEEVASMPEYCSTGHLGRFISVIQGFTGDDDELEIRIGDAKHIQSVLSHYFAKRLNDAPDSVIDAMIGEDKRPFLQYIEDIVNRRMAEYVDECVPLSDPKADEIRKQLFDHACDYIKEYTIEQCWEVKGNVRSDQTVNYTIALNVCNIGIKEEDMHIDGSGIGGRPIIPGLDDGEDMTPDDGNYLGIKSRGGGMGYGGGELHNFGSEVTVPECTPLDETGYGDVVGFPPVEQADIDKALAKKKGRKGKKINWEEIRADALKTLNSPMEDSAEDWKILRKLEKTINSKTKRARDPPEWFDNLMDAFDEDNDNSADEYRLTLLEILNEV